MQAAEASLAAAQVEINSLVQSSKDSAMAVEKRMQEMQSELQAAKVGMNSAVEHQGRLSRHQLSLQA